MRRVGQHKATGGRAGVFAFIVVAILSTCLSARSARALDPHRTLDAYALKKWNVEEGLPTGSLTTIVQSRDGYIWIGTQNGLVRFDGYEFDLFSAANTPAFVETSGVRTLALDDQGALWIGTSAALIRYAHGKFESIDAFRSTAVLAITPDSDGTVWIGTSTGLCGLRDGKRIELEGGSLAQGTAVTLLVKDAEQGIWFAGKAAPLRRLHAGHAETFVDDRGEIVAEVHTMATTRDGTRWLATEGGLLRQEGNRFVRVPASLKRLEQDAPVQLLVDRGDTLWVGWRGSGVSRLRNGQMIDEPVPPEFAKHLIMGSLEDTEGNIWLTTYAGGLFMLHDGLFRSIRPPDRTLNVTAVRETSDGALWLGTYEEGIFRLLNGTWRHFDESDGLPTGLVSALHEDEEETLWVGGAHGVCVWKGGRFERLHRLPGDGNEGAVMAFAGTSTSLWIGTSTHGVRHRTAQGIQTFGVDDGLPVKQVWALGDNHDGTIWFGTSAGAARYRNGRIEAVPLVGTAKDAKPIFPLVSEGFWQDQAGAIWITSTVGIGRLDGEKFLIYPASAGLPPEAHALIGDDLGDLWFGANTGICRVEAREVEKLVKTQTPVSAVRCFDEADGLRKRETNYGGPGVIRLHDGKLLFGTTDGAAVVDPREVLPQATVPRTLIQRFEADGEALSVEGMVLVARGTRHLHIEFTGLAFVAPKRTRYRYRLAGFDPAFIDVGDRRSADYTNVPPGDYEFIVMTSGGDGTWPSQGAVVRFRLLPYFYQTRLFYTVVLAGSLLVAFGSYRWRVRRLQATAAMLESRVNERTNELRMAVAQLETKDQRIAADLQAARAFQRALLPELAGGSVVECAALYEPAEQVGGDIYDVEELRPGFFRIFIADTTGHGVQASLRTMLLKSEYDRLKRDAPSPAMLLGAVNDRLTTHYAGKVRCSACCVDVHVRRAGGAGIVYSNAAHPDLLLLRAGGGSSRVYVPGMYFGFAPRLQYNEQEATLEPGDVLVIYSDGATEESNAAGAMFGIDRLAEALAGVLTPTTELGKVLSAAHDEIRKFVATGAEGRIPSDDITIILLRLKAPAIRPSDGPARNEG